MQRAETRLWQCYALRPRRYGSWSAEDRSMDPNEANESVAEKFTTVMNATPSALAVLCDFSLVSVVSGILLAIGLFVIRHSHEPARLYAVLAVAAVPFAASYGVQLTLRRS